ncbi:Biofilm regulator BssS (plasmid) [Mycobacterium sp. JS623]|uniref:DUF4226 domain-containing protein n=1 Tax=Mycobacterium sp. JS623 TaxID=212767 RepID=UPI0002A557B6|nr:DUF4226 domain-containing protein [Mycobacterium sp. JS623]AGB26863.1 Biofilm regulator BssS [Mycobacterium sp. JS623]
MSRPKHFDGQTHWDIWDSTRGTQGLAQPGWAMPSDPTRYIGQDDPYWTAALYNARHAYGDPNIHYDTDNASRQRHLVFGDQTPLPTDATVVYHDSSTKQNWAQNDDGTVALVGPDGITGPPMAPAGYRKVGSGYAPIDAHGQQIAPQVGGVPSSDNGFHTNPATGVLTPKNADGAYFTLGPDGKKSFFDKDGHPITEDQYTKGSASPAPDPALATDEQQSGKAADAVGKLQGELKKKYSSISEAEEKLSEVLLSAHAASAAGQRRLGEIQTKIIDAVNNTAMSIDTPAGERSFLTFLHSQVGAINDLVTSGSLTADDQAKTTQALSKLYAVDDSGADATESSTAPTPPVAAAPPEAEPTDAGLGSAEPMPDPSLSDVLGGVPLGTGMGADPLSSLGSLPGALGGLGGAPGTPLDGLGGLAGAIAPLAGLASQAGDHGSDRSPDAVQKTDDSTGTPREAKDGKETGGAADKTEPVGEDPAGADHATGAPPAAGPPPPLAPPAPPTSTVRLPDGSSATARTPAAAQAVTAYLGGDTVDAAYSKNNLALPPPGTPVTDPVDPSQLACGDVGIFKDHYVVALSSVKALANGQVVPLGSVASSPDFLGWIDPTATAARPHPAPPPPAVPPSPAPDALADAASAVPAG